MALDDSIVFSDLWHWNLEMWLSPERRPALVLLEIRPNFSRWERGWEYIKSFIPARVFLVCYSIPSSIPPLDRQMLFTMGHGDVLVFIWAHFHHRELQSLEYFPHLWNLLVLQSGDVVECEIDGIGCLRNQVVGWIVQKNAWNVSRRNYFVHLSCWLNMSVWLYRLSALP